VVIAGFLTSICASVRLFIPPVLVAEITLVFVAKLAVSLPGNHNPRKEDRWNRQNRFHFSLSTLVKDTEALELIEVNLPLRRKTNPQVLLKGVDVVIL